MMRRMFAMLLALLILVGNIPAQAFAEDGVPQETAACATEGCSYGAGHEGNCSNYVEPCSAEGCEYPAGHDGNCSNYVEPCSTEGCEYPAGHEGNCSNYVEPCSTEGCEYPAGHEGNCSNYVEPCSTEGCEYPAGHEGNCSNYVEPCSTEGCEYPAGHEGNCSNFVQQPDPDVAAANEVIALIDAIGQVTLESEAAIAAADRAYSALTEPQKALVTNADVLTAAKNAYTQLSAQPDTADGNPADPATVTVTISDHGVLALVQAEITVTDLNEDGQLSFDEAMVITHQKHCPDGYATVPHPDYYLTVTKFWKSGSENGTANILTFTNDVCNQMNLGQTYIQEGDRLYGAVLKNDFGFDDWYSYFTQEEVKVDAGEPFELTLMGYYGMAFGEVTSVPTAGVDIGTWADGKFTSLNTKTDEDGKVKLCFDTPGTYVVSADGVVPYDPYEYGEVKCPLIPPACVVTVRAVQTQTAVESVTLNQTSAQLTVGDTLTLVPTILPGNAANHNVSWSTTNPNIASVEFGKVTAVAKGTATITVTTEDGGKTAQCQVTVNNPAVSAVTVKPTSLTITQGDAPVHLTATITPANAEVNEIKWSSENLSVATVDKDGYVTAGTKTGDTVITVTAGGKSADCTVTVLEAPAASGGGISIDVGDESNGMGDLFLSKIVLVGLGGTVSPRESNTWKVELDSGTDIKQPITFEMTSSLFPNVKKSMMYFWANGKASAENVEDKDPGSVTITPEWSEGKATVALGVKTQGATGFNRTYTLQLSVAGITQNALPVLADPENGGAKERIIVGETYTLNLAPLFTDKDEDKLTYKVQIGDASPVPADADYRWQPSQPGGYTLIFRANDGKGDSEECYTVELEVEKNTAPSITGDRQIEDKAKQYYPWTIDLSKVFTDAQGGELTYTVAVNGADPVEAAAAYSYTPESTLDQTLVFRAADPSGAVSEPFTVTLKVEPVPRTIIQTGCTGSGNSDTWVKEIAVIGVEVQSTLRNWNVTANHGETEPHILRVELDKETPADAVVTLSYTLAGTTELLMGTVSGPDSVTLQDGKATATVTSTGFLGSAGTERTYVLNFTREPNAVPTAAPARDTVGLTVGEAYSVDLTKIFSAGDSDPLTYRLSIDGVDEGAVETDYSRTITSAGTYEFVFTAEDPWGAAATYAVTITAAVPVKTFDARFLVPKGITPAFYTTKSFNGEAGDTYDGDALTATAGEAEAGFVPYTVKVPEKVKRVSFRGTDGNGTEWGGMTAAVSAQGETVVLAQVAALIPSKVDGSFATADQVKFQLKDMDGHYLVSGGTHTDTYGAVCYRFLVHAMGTEDLVKAYTAYAVPAKALESRYTTTVGNNITFPTAEPRQELQLNMTLISTLSITVPDGAEVRVFQQKQYYNSPEIHVEETIENEDDTTTWIFEKGNNAFTTYRVSMEGKITKAGYVAADEIEVSWNDDDPAPNCRDPYDLSTLYGSRGDDSVVLNVNGRNHLVLNQGDSFRLRAYRIWEIINNDSSNIIIQPDMHWSAVGDDILTLAPVESGNGNGVNNWMDITAKGNGVAFLEVSYDALQIATGNASGFGGEEIDGFTFRACDSARTGLVVVQVGNAATDVNFGIHCSSVQNNSNAAWDAEFDTLYFTGSSGELSLTPSVSSGEIDKVEVSGNKGASWTELMAAEGSYTANIGSGNHVIRITKTDGTEAYQVVRGDRVSVTITQTKDGGDGDAVVEPGETFRVQLHGIHNPIGKMSGNYNPGFQQGQHLNYRFNGQNVSTSSHYQYNFVSNAWVNITIPREAEPGESFALTGGYISFNLIGIGDVTSDTENHRGIGDDGCMTRGSGGSQHQRSLLPEITLTVGRNTDGSNPTVAVQSVTLNKTAATLAPGSTVALTATVLPSNATNQTVTWTTSNAAVATVTNGTVSAIGAGTARITATAGGQSAVCTITVAVPVTGIALSQTTAAMEVGDTLTLRATVTPEDATNPAVTWTSSQSAVASVINGTVTASAPGTTVITAAAGEQTATCTVTVTAAQENPGQEDSATVTISFEDRGIRLDSELSNINAIYRNPLGTIIAPTQVEIEPYDTIADVTVKLLNSLGITPVYTGTTKSGFYLSSIGNFTANGRTYASFGEFNAGSGSGWMITHNNTFIGRGASDFTVEDGDVICWQYTCQLGEDIGGGDSTGGGTGGSGEEEDKNTTVAVTKIELNKSSLSLKVNGTETLTATLTPSNATATVTWSSDKADIAAVDADGKVTGKKAGTAIITATAGGKTATCTVTVTSSSTSSAATSTGTGGKTTTTTTTATSNAATVASLIRALPTAINKTHEKQVLAALDAYNALSDAQKKALDSSLVTKLEDAKRKLAKTMTTAQEQGEAEDLEKQIEALGNVTLDSEASIQSLRAAYDKLTKYQQFLVGNSDKLEAAEKKLAQLKAASDPKYVYQTTGDYLSRLGTPGVGAIGGEWMVIGLARSGREVPSGYYDHVLEYVRQHINAAEQLHSAKSSDNSRVIMGLTAIGKDVTNVDGHNLLVGLSSMDYIQKQGINGPIWALLAFDSGNYPVPDGDVSREKLVAVVLDAQLSDGGWALSGKKADPDMTGMAIQALVPYMQSNTSVQKAVERAIQTLSKIQNDDGSFSSVDGPNCESIAQVIVALATLGIDADSDERFVKNGISALDALIGYFVSEGGFSHLRGGKKDGMATEQAYYALTAYYRMQQKQTPLYDMTDVIDRGGDAPEAVLTEPTETATEPVAREEESGGKTVLIWSGVMALCAGAIALVLANRKKLFGKFL